MPLYEYGCVQCGSRFEVLQRMGQDGSTVSCPRCGETRVEKQYSTFAGSSSGATGSSTAGCSPSGRFT